MTSLESEVLWLSLQVAGLATLGLMPIATGVAYVLSRSRFWAKPLLEGLVAAPLVLPPVVTGYLLLVVLGRKGFVGEPLHEVFGFSLSFQWGGAAVAGAVVAFPLAVRALRQSFDSIEPGLEQAAAVLGASPWQVFLRITLPLALPGVVSGALLAFARSLGEFGATITFVGNVAGQTRTLPLAIYTAMQQPGGEAAATRLVALSVALAVLAIVVSEVWAQRVKRRWA
jgi:molybdate transport system permease protein